MKSFHLRVKTFTPKQIALFWSPLLWTRPRTCSKRKRSYRVFLCVTRTQMYCFCIVITVNTRTSWCQHVFVYLMAWGADVVVDVLENRFLRQLSLAWRAAWAIAAKKINELNTSQMKYIKMNLGWNFPEHFGMFRIKAKGLTRIVHDGWRTHFLLTDEVKKQKTSIKKNKIQHITYSNVFYE